MVSGMFNTISALNAFGKKLGVTADNVANASTDGFKKSRATLHEGPGGSVKVEINKVETPGPVVTEGTDESLEQRELSNVDPAEEIPQALVAEKMFAANAKVLETEEERIGSLLDIIG